MRDRAIDLEQLTDWWSSPLGRCVLERERSIVRDRFASVFGFHLALLGLCLQCRLVDSSLVPHHYVINPYKLDVSAVKCVKGFWEMLPVLSDSLDVVVVPHALEISSDPSELLNEVRRSLIPEGRVLIFGFNPHSLWRLKDMFKKNKVMPWSCQFYSSRFVRDELSRLGFTIVKHERFFLQPPLRKLRFFHRLNFLNKLAWLGFSQYSGVYYIEAQKKIIGVRPLKVELAAAQKVRLRYRVQGTVSYGEKNEIR